MACRCGMGQLTEDQKAFASKLNTESGTYVYFDKQAASAEMFLKWLAIYDPATSDYLAKINSLKAEGQAAAEVPGWVKTGQVRVKQDVYDLYQASITRIGEMMRDQGVVVVTVKEDIQGFLGWWMQYDRAGFAAFIVTNVQVVVSADAVTSTDIPSISAPQSLFNFWKVNQGKLPPTNQVLGLPWVGWEIVKKYWAWILVGVAGGVVVAKMGSPAQREAARLRREQRKFEIADTLPGVVEGPRQNPRAKFHDSFPTTISLKSGSYDLIPLIPDTTYEELRAMSRRVAHRFRVISGGRKLGELIKSRGSRRWKAVSYQGVVKHGQNRATLLTWLKKQAPLQAAKLAAKDPEKAAEAHQVAKALAANGVPVWNCPSCTGKK
jgi:hypothetical protein